MRRSDASGPPAPARLYSAAPWGNLSGAPICALEHLQVLRDRFAEVCLVLCRPGPLADRARAANVPIWCSPFVFRGLRHAGPGRFLRGIGEVARSRWAYVRDLRRRLREKPGILHIHSRAAHLPYALLAGRWARVPVVVTIHEPWAGGWEARSEMWLVRLLADRVVFLSRAMVAQYPRGLKQVAVVYNPYPLPPERRPPRNARPLIALVGQMVKAKGTDLFLRICRQALDCGADFDAWMIGHWLADRDRAEVERGIAEHGLGGVVSIRGPLDPMGPVYERLDVLVLPTRRDSFPRVVMEAMAHGIPVVATRVDGIPEMVADGVTGLLAGSEDVAGFARAVATLVRDEELRLRLGAAGRERARQLFAPERYVAAMDAIYAGLRGDA